MTVFMKRQLIKPIEKIPSPKKLFKPKIKTPYETVAWMLIYLTFVGVNIGGFITIILFVTDMRDAPQTVIEIDTNRILHTTNEKFLSIALDTSIIAKGWRRFDLSSPVVANMISAFSPAYLRFGGTAADCVIFNSRPQNGSSISYPISQESCSFRIVNCGPNKRNISMNEIDWLRINKFVKKVGLELIFDLNALLRENEKWDPTNARKLIEFSREHNLNLSWQLGNEPDLFKHAFNEEVTGTQLAKDFFKLREILDKAYGTHVKLIGPDVTRPNAPDLHSVSYLIDFLKEIRKQEREVIDAVSWHHYYLNGREATLKDFYNTSNFKYFHQQIQFVKNVVSFVLPGTSVWITETSDSYGGGTPNITDRFVGGFMWMEKLGLAAASGIDVVARQSIFGGYYALIDDGLNPTPDFWLSVLHKKLVGTKVLSILLRNEDPCSRKTLETLKFYAHCAPREQFSDEDAITIFGYNVGPHPENVLIDVDLDMIGGVKIYTLMGEYGLQSRYTLLNGKRLVLNKDGTLPPLEPIIQRTSRMIIPPYAMVFWQLYDIQYPTCELLE